ncbi:MaoC family dehydratase [Chloroflexota bacterium]
MTDKDIPILEKLGVDIGYKATHTKTITEEDIALFAKVSGDYNPVHMSEEYAQKTLFGGRIAHGVIAVALLSAAMAKLPGLVILLNHSSRFLKPVRIGDTITAVAEATNVRKEKGIVILKNTCINQNGETVVEGETTVRLYEAPSG